MKRWEKFWNKIISATQSWVIFLMWRMANSQFQPKEVRTYCNTLAWHYKGREDISEALSSLGSLCWSSLHPTTITRIGTMESPSLEKTSKIIKSSFDQTPPWQPNPGTEWFLEPLQGLAPPWAVCFKAQPLSQGNNSSWTREKSINFTSNFISDVSLSSQIKSRWGCKSSFWSYSA